MITTLNKIRAHDPCANGWRKLLAHLGKTQADDDPLPILTILDSNGLDDALWCLRAVDGHDREIRLYALWCARQVQHLMKDPRSVTALDVVERRANGDARLGELKAAWDAARAAAGVTWTVAGLTWAAASAAGAAERSAPIAAWSAASAARSAESAAWSAQSTRLREICTPVVTKSQQQENV